MYLWLRRTLTDWLTRTQHMRVEAEVAKASMNESEG